MKQKTEADVVEEDAAKNASSKKLSPLARVFCI